MEKCLRSALFVLSFLLASINQSDASSCEQVTIAGHPDFPPLIWSDSVKMRGAGPETAEKIFTEMGVKVKYWDRQPYVRILHHLEMGKIDFLGGMAKNNRREKYTTFVEPPLTQLVPYIFTSIDKVFEFSTWDQLKGLRGATHRGASFGTKFDDFARENLDLVEVRNFEASLKLLARGRVDYVVDHYRRAQIKIDELNYEDQIVALNRPLGDGVQGIYYGFSKRSPCRHLAKEFGQRLQKYIENGAVEHLMHIYTWKFDLPN